MKPCSYFNFYSRHNIWKKQLYRVSGSEFYEWLFWPEKFSGLSRSGPQEFIIRSIVHWINRFLLGPSISSRGKSLWDNCIVFGEPCPLVQCAFSFLIRTKKLLPWVSIQWFFLAPPPPNSLSLLHSWPQIFYFRRTLRARGTVESWLYNVELAMYETVKMWVWKWNAFVIYSQTGRMP